MTIAKQIAKHWREINNGGNWTGANLKNILDDVTWQEAITPVRDLNTIAALTFHINYYVVAILCVLEDKPFEAHDKFSYDAPPIESVEDWQNLVEKTFREAETLAKHIEIMPDEALSTIFVKEKYGNFYRNFHGLIEHTHYHTGQIALIKKLIRNNENI